MPVQSLHLPQLRLLSRAAGRALRGAVRTPRAPPEGRSGLHADRHGVTALDRERDAADEA
jgi:hypothetical protein